MIPAETIREMLKSATPGSWFDDGYRIHAPTEDEDKRNGRVITDYKQQYDFNHPDAKLLASAPDLAQTALEALCESGGDGETYLRGRGEIRSIARGYY